MSHAQRQTCILFPLKLQVRRGDLPRKDISLLGAMLSFMRHRALLFNFLPSILPGFSRKARVDIRDRKGQKLLAGVT